MNRFLILCAISIASLFVACDDDSSKRLPDGVILNPNDVPVAVLDAFEKQYPNAVNVRWEKKNGYAVATFNEREGNKDDQSAWFSWSEGVWGMTEYEILYDALPDNVRAAFESSKYAANPWKKSREVDVLQRNESETLYVIEVSKDEKGKETEVDLYYSSDGILVKEIADAEDDKDYYELLPQRPESFVSNWLNTNYPDARIVDMEIENGMTEIEFIHNGLKLEALFDGSSAWMQTKTEYEGKWIEEVPVNLEIIKNTYPDARIEEVVKYETVKNGVYYCVELESRFDDDMKVYIDEEGREIERPIDNPITGGIPVGNNIENFIADRYPGAVIIEKDYDDGYTEVGFRHDSYIKEAYFTGSEEWVCTTWDIHPDDLPEAVRLTLKQKYSNYRIDGEVEVIENSTFVQYEVEIENGRHELKLIFSKDGEVLQEVSD